MITAAPSLGYAAARQARASEIDHWLAGLLETADDVALVAVGSYGRGELNPGSDLDLVLVHAGRPDVAEIADQLWYPIWDSGLRLDHAVRTAGQAREVARQDLKAVLGLIYARHVAGDPGLTSGLRSAVLADWRTDARRRLPGLAEMTRLRWERQGELAFLLEPDLKEARGGLRDVHALQAVAATWAGPGPSAAVKAAYRLILDTRHALHEATGRASDRLVFQEQDAVARALGYLDADALLRALAGAARAVTYAADNTWRGVERYCRRERRTGARSPLADGVVEQDGEVVLARAADAARDPGLVLRAAAAAAQAGLPLAPATVEILATAPPLPVPWPASAREALVTLLGAGRPAIGVWEALDQAGIITELLPDWERVRNRPQRDPVHTFTVDRHLIETAVRAAALSRDVARPDLLLLGALLHDIGKGWPGDHSVSGAVMARDVGARLGLCQADVEMLVLVVRHHLLLPETAMRRDLDDPATIQRVAFLAGSHEVLELLAALAAADGQATGPTAWGPWKASLVGELVRRAGGVMAGRTLPPLPEPSPRQLSLARLGAVAIRVSPLRAGGTRITVVAPDAPGLLWRVSGVLALHRLAVRAATAVTQPGSGGPAAATAVIEFAAVPEFGSGPDPAALEADLRRMLAGRLDVADRLARRTASRRARPGFAVPPPRVTLVEGASRNATVFEVRAHDQPGLLWRIGEAFEVCGLQIVAARADTLGAEAIDVFYVVGADGGPITDDKLLEDIPSTILTAVWQTGDSSR